MSVVEGGAAIFAPKRDGTFTMVANIPPEGWMRLADEAERSGK